ncbi:NAD(P)H-dependent oxidoreductase [Myxococcota bacterium]|nr:NAD(P)H-dependent oxidoreductase [Myxococcota bacterium]MBU1896850.1 NAD(P)H-dependent oxidoreductase [Myxococcota bacterium]
MRKTLVIVGHPKLRGGSIANQIIVDALAEAGAEIRDLGAHYPDYKIDVSAEQAALVAADQIILQFPLYWYSVPAILKAWIDQVLTYGFAYGSTGKALHGKALYLSLTTGGPAEAYQPEGYNRFTLDALLTPLRQTAHLCGMTYEAPVISNGMIYMPGVSEAAALDALKASALDHAARLKAALSA